MKKYSEKTNGVINASDLKTVKGRLVYWSFFSILVITCLVCVIPTLWVLCTGFKDTQEIYSSASFFPKNFSLDSAYERMLEALRVMNFGKGLINTMVVSIGEAVFRLVVCGLGGYTLSRLKPKGTTLIFTLIVWTMMMPAQIRTVPLFMSYIKFPFVSDALPGVSLLNTYWPMWLKAAATPFYIILFKNQFDSISISLIESAKLDGCSKLRIFFNILLPLSVPTVIYITIVTIKASWSEFFTGYLILSDKDLWTIPVTIFKLKSDVSIKMNVYMLCLILASVPVFLIYILFQRHIVGGTNVGGVKE